MVAPFYHDSKMYPDFQHTDASKPFLSKSLFIVLDEFERIICIVRKGFFFITIQLLYRGLKRNIFTLNIHYSQPIFREYSLFFAYFKTNIHYSLKKVDVPGYTIFRSAIKNRIFNIPLQFWAHIQYSFTILSQYSIFIIPLQPPMLYTVASVAIAPTFLWK